MLQQFVILCVRITFTFKSSRKSNNGTDINAGQIPEILYRTAIPDSLSISTIHTSNNDVHILSDAFSHTVNKVLKCDLFQIKNAFFLDCLCFFYFHYLFCMVIFMLLFYCISL